jgi:sialidase-1
MKIMFWAKVKMVAAVLCAVAAVGTGGTWSVAAALAADPAPATGEKPAQDRDWMASLREGWPARDAYARDWDRKAPKPVRVFSHGGRVPLIVLTHEGTLLAFQEKYVEGGDLGDHDVVVIRSTDGGKTWSDDLLIFDAGKANCNHTIPVVAADGTIWLMFTVRLKEVFVTHSRDDGRTWAEPKVIATEKHVWTGHHSILLSSGRMLFAANSEGGDQWCYYSDDHGATWKKSEPFARGGLQTSLVELVDGTVYANIRRFGRHRQPNPRWEAWSRDGGMTWSGMEKSKQILDVASIGCSSSVIRVTDGRVHDRNRVIFCGPDDGGDPKKPLGRVNGTVYISYDECKTWKKCKRIVDGKFGYSDLVLLPDMSVGCIYESAGGYSCSFLRFTVEWITDGEDKVDFSKFKKK